MSRFFTSLSRLAAGLRAFGLLWLALNIAIVSIPRCDVLFSSLMQHDDHNHCVLAEAAAQSQHVETIQVDHHCQCQLLSFVFSAIEWSDPRHEIRQPASEPVTIVFDYLAQPLMSPREVDGPPPKSV